MARTEEQQDSLLDSLGFELPRRPILFHSTTEMPDQSLLGYTGDPNNAVNGNTPGETLLHNCPSGLSSYCDKGIDPFVIWDKIGPGAGGLWIKRGTGTGGVIVAAALLTFKIPANNCSNRWMSHDGVISNIIGFRASVDSVIINIAATTENFCTGVFHIYRKAYLVEDRNGSLLITNSGDYVSANPSYVEIATVPFEATNAVTLANQSIAVLEGDEIAIFWESPFISSANYPNITLTLQI